LAVLVFLPFWIGYDILFKRETLFKFYGLFENTLRRKWVAILAIALILLNWAWNIWKDV
jgi:hypothetical protein